MKDQNAIRKSFAIKQSLNICRIPSLMRVHKARDHFKSKNVATFSRQHLERLQRAQFAVDEYLQ